MESTITVNNLQLNYKAGGSGDNVILLHGWGCDLNIFSTVQQNLQTGFRVFALDLPGFGKSQEPPIVWGVEEYTTLVEQFIKQLNIENPVLVGHSFGGRISILLSSRNPVKKVILVDSAGIKLQNTKTKISSVLSKVKNTTGKIFGEKAADALSKPMRKYLGSADYQNASGMMREILKKVVSEDLQHVMPQIKASTLLIWGELDTATPVADAKIMEKLIPDAGLVVLKNCGHYSFLENTNDFLVIVNNFLGRKNG